MMPASLFDKSPMSAQQDDLAVYMAAVRALHSDDPTVRRPAISVLLEFARRGQSVVRAHAEGALTQEFGPYAVSEGLSGCSAPIEVVEGCDGNCRSCVWLWLNQPDSQRASVVLEDLDSQPAESCLSLRARSVANAA